MISRWIKRHTHTRILFICHNVTPHEGGGTLDRRLALTVLRQGDYFIVHSEEDRHRLHALLPQVPVKKVFFPTLMEISEQSVPTSREVLRQQLGVPDDRPIVLFFGFVRPYKGLEYLIQALPKVLEKLKIHLLVVGEFWNSPEFYQRYAREFGGEEAITFVNRYIPNEEMGAYFDLADVVVLPYISATQSGVVQLAFGFGKPVITTRVGGLQEVVRDGHNGLVVPPQNEEALAEAIVRYFTEGLGPKMSERIRRDRDAGSFSWQELVQAVEETASGWA
jgi:glycosyltransferase involved in cell wall biosynthesis